MAVFKSLDQLQKHLQKAINQALQEEVAEEVRKIEIEQIEKTVYSVYLPKTYERRKSQGGLSDPSNIRGDLISDGMLEVGNYTIVNPYLEDTNTGRLYKSKNAADDGYLTPIIVEGTPYDISPDGAKYGDKRDFIQSTKDELMKGGQHVEALKRGLAKEKIVVK